MPVAGESRSLVRRGRDVPEIVWHFRCGDRGEAGMLDDEGLHELGHVERYVPM